MAKRWCGIILGITIISAAFGTTADSERAARAQLKRCCTGCHSLEVIQAQHLPRDIWDRELTKMSLMGAEVQDRRALLDYLEKKYGERSR